MIINSEFRPAWWLSNPHLQTIVASKLSQRPDIDTRHERIELADGDFLDLNHSIREQGPLVCLFHGLAGCIDSGYIKGAFQALEQCGMRPVLMHWRGCSGEPNRLARSYHSGETDDIRFLVDLLQMRHPDVPILAVGYSLGGNALLKYLGEEGDDCPVSGAIAVCPPLVLHVGADKLNSGIAKGYQRYLIGQMRDQHEAKRKCHPELDLKPAGPELDTFWKFDDALTAPLHGYEDAQDYYTQCSARQYLSQIQTPTHVIYALDDPFFTPEVIPHEHELSASVTLETTDQGGHVGFLQGRRPGQLEYWLDARVAEVLSAALNRVAAMN